MYKRGCTDTAMVKLIQEALGIKQDGDFGPRTEAAVINFQRDNHLVADGIVGEKTLDLLGILDTDLRMHTSFIDKNVTITKHYLSPGEYKRNSDNTPIQNNYLFLHHTAGWYSPINTIDDWNRDNRGAIGTEFVIGGSDFITGNTIHNGSIVQAFPTGCQAWHLGKVGSIFMSKHSVGIEVCNMGQLTDKYKTYTGITVPKDYVTTLNKPFRGYTNWHTYTDEQLYALKKLIYFVADRDNIDIRRGVQKWLLEGGSEKAFAFNEAAYKGEIHGLLLHCNVRKDKVDMSPQPNLIDMLLSL